MLKCWLRAGQGMVLVSTALSAGLLNVQGVWGGLMQLVTFPVLTEFSVVLYCTL